MSVIPPDYKHLKLVSPFANHVAAFYERQSPEGRTIAARVEPHHCNSQGFAHGGFLLALADVALSYGTYEPGDTPPRVTLSISVDFASGAEEGEWVEAHVDLQKSGGRIIFANCFICVGERRLVRASGVFTAERPR